MKVFSTGLALSTALTVATLILTAPMTWAQDGLFGAYDPRQQETLWNEAIYLQSSGQQVIRAVGSVSKITADVIPW